jgi:hypothetical protein
MGAPEHSMMDGTAEAACTPSAGPVTPAAPWAARGRACGAPTLEAGPLQGQVYVVLSVGAEQNWLGLSLWL